LNIGIGTENLVTFTAALQQELKGTQTVFSSVMKAFDRASFSIFMVLALTPMLAVAAAASIH